MFPFYNFSTFLYSSSSWTSMYTVFSIQCTIYNITICTQKSYFSIVNSTNKMENIQQYTTVTLAVLRLKLWLCRFHIQKNETVADCRLPMLFSFQFTFCIHVIICHTECDLLHSSSTNITLPFANTTNQQPKSKIYNPFL